LATEAVKGMGTYYMLVGQGLPTDLRCIAVCCK